jgi:hypothetical protein
MGLLKFHLLWSEANPLTCTILESTAKYNCLISRYLAWLANRVIEGPPNKLNPQVFNNLIFIMVIVHQNIDMRIRFGSKSIP